MESDLSEKTVTDLGGALDHREKRSIILGVLTVMLLAALDQTIVAPAMATIGAALGNPEYLPWIVTAYLLTATATAPLYGKVADIYGRRPVLAAAIVIFLAGSVMAALAPNMPTLIAGRTVQGLGGGGLFVLAQTVIGDTVPPRERAIYAGYISGAWAVASIAGPLLGGIFAQHWHWSLIFWINLPLGAVALLVLLGPLSKLSIRPRSHSLDFLGGTLVLAATIPLMLALTWGGFTYPWTSRVILALISLSLLFYLMLALHLARASEPLIPLEVLGNPVVKSATLAVFFGVGANVAIAVYVPIYLQAHLGLTVSSSGAALITYIMGTTLGAAVAGKLTSRLARYKLLAVGGLAMAAACLAVMAMVAHTTSLVIMGALLFVAGAGFGTMFPIGTVSVQNAVEHRNLGVATSVLTFMRNLGSAMGVATIGAVALASGLPGLREDMVLGPEIGATTVHAFRNIFIAAAVAASVAALFFLRMEGRELRDVIANQ